MLKRGFFTEPTTDSVKGLKYTRTILSVMHRVHHIEVTEVFIPSCGLVFDSNGNVFESDSPFTSDESFTSDEENPVFKPEEVNVPNELIKIMKEIVKLNSQAEVINFKIEGEKEKLQSQSDFSQLFAPSETDTTLRNNAMEISP